MTVGLELQAIDQNPENAFEGSKRCSTFLIACNAREIGAQFLDVKILAKIGSIKSRQGVKMAGKKNRGVLRDIVEIISSLPWWVGVVLAILSYLALHMYVTQQVGQALTDAQSRHVPLRAVVQGLAEAFQYILPGVFLAGAALSFWKRNRRSQLVKVVTDNTTATILNAMSWQEFEALVGEGFRLRGYRVLEQGGSAPDGGVDLQLFLGPEQYLVQCKQWKAFKVGVEVVRELYGVMAAKGAAGGFVVTSGQFTRGAQEFAEGRNIGLIDGKALFSMLQSAKKSLGDETPPVQKASKSSTASTTHSCPSCGSLMVKRETKRGGHTGQSFWGCSTYPKCKVILPLQKTTS